MTDTLSLESALHTQTATVIDENLHTASGAKWQVKAYDPRNALMLAQRYQLSSVTAQAIAGRGITFENVEDYLTPSLRNSLPDPSQLKDIKKFLDRITQAIEGKQKIVVFGDYDVDGATSSALLILYFRKLGIDVGYYIPDRIKEGYGPNARALVHLKEQGCDVCITVDCGTLAFEPLAEAAKAGLDMLVIDHHLGAEMLPVAEAVVNPNRLDEDFPVKDIAAVGVAFLILVALNTHLQQRDWFAKQKISKPNLLEFLDIVALGTVCDVMPLKGLNRAFVAQGLKVLQQRKNLGLKTLADVAGINSVPAAYHLGYVLGPRINAGGRVGKSSLGTELLTSNDPHRCDEIANQLEHFNAERKTLEQQVLEQAIECIESSGKSDAPVLFACGEGWHPGVIGIVASRLKERYYRPAAVISLENGIGKASARSIHGVDFGSHIVAASQSGLLLAGGGHAMAAGFTVEEAAIPKLYDFLSTRFAKHANLFTGRQLYADGILSLSGITKELLAELAIMEPYGTGNYEPKFIIPNVNIVKWDILKGEHLRCFLRDSHAGKNNKTMKAMAFRCAETELGAMVMACKPHQSVHLLCKAKLSTWQGVDSVELMVEDAGLA